jgi:hypothetical protein
MAETKRMTCEQVVGYLLEGEGLDFLRESLSWVVQQLMEAEVSELVGAAHGERAPEERLRHRVGFVNSVTAICREIVFADRRVKRCAVRARSGRKRTDTIRGMALHRRAFRAAARLRSRSGSVLRHRRPSGRERGHSQALAEREFAFSPGPGVGGMRRW